MFSKRQKITNIKVLVQIGNLGSSVIDHLITPLSLSDKVDKVLIFSHNPGPVIPKVEYHCPPPILKKLPSIAVFYEIMILVYYALFRKSAIIAGFLLNPHGIIAFIIAKMTRKKVVIYLIAGRHEFYANNHNRGSIKDIDFNNKMPPWYGRLFINILKHTDAIITTGTVTKNYLIKSGIDSRKVFPIISPVNSLRFHQIITPKIYDLLSVGNLQLIKHHEILLKSIFEVKKKHPGVKACIVGDGPRKCQLVQLVDKLELKQNIDFVGFQKDVPYYYHISKILVHTSETEGFPNVVLEAMACGLPVIVSDCGDVIDIAKNGFNSLIIPKFDDYKEFADAINLLLENNELYNNISYNALKSFGLISVNDTTRKWEQIIDKNVNL